MNSRNQIIRVTDQLSYNLVYAPDYPEEDQTDLESQEREIQACVDEVLSSVRREDVRKWLRFGASRISAAFEKYRQGDEMQACREIEAAISYLRNAFSVVPVPPENGIRGPK